MRDAESLLDQVVSFAGQNVEDSQIGAVLGIIDRDLIYKMCRAIIDADITICLEIIDEVHNYGYEIKEFYREIMNQFRNLIVSLVAPDSPHLLDLPDNELRETKDLAGKAGTERLVQSLNFLISKEGDLRYTHNPRIALEATLIKLSELKNYLSFDELMRKIADIEKRIHKPLSTEHSENIRKNTAQREPAAGTNSVDNDKKWHEFLGYLATKNRAMANVLKESGSYTLTADRLELPYGEGAFTGGYFDDPEHYEQLCAYAQDFFQSNLKIVFKRQNQSKDSKTGPQQDTVSPPVREIMDIFEGRIVNRD
jgi:DNA polymerase-3 subunit gamma/tau